MPLGVTHVLYALITLDFVLRKKIILSNRFLCINQGKLLTQHNPRYFFLLRAYLGWALKPMSQIYQILQYCVQKHIVVGAVEGCFNCQLEDRFQKVFHFVVATYLKFQKCKVSNEVQSNKINRGASTAVIVSYIHITK